MILKITRTFDKTDFEYREDFTQILNIYKAYINQMICYHI